MTSSAQWLAIVVGVIACAAPVGVRDRADGSRWIDDGDLFRVGFGTVSFVAKDGHSLEARTYRSTGFDPLSDPVWFIMHGTDRDVGRYIDAAAPVAERHDALAVAIHFTAEAYPAAEDYTLGIYAEPGSDDRWRDPDDMLYAEIERVFDLVRASLGGSQPGYHLFGHSAGAQFTHRLLTFVPEHRALVAVAANAGWYTLPAAEDPSVHTMPYGLLDGPIDPDDVAGLLETPLVVLLSENDTATAATDDLVRGTPAAEAQGKNRLERGRHYFAVGSARARALDVGFAWRIEIVPGADHDVRDVISTAGDLTFLPGSAAAACTHSSLGPSAGILITEILADPPEGPAGDANGDGAREPDGDEFVEIANTGGAPVCLAGWSLGDATSAARHVFGVGALLEPGGVAVVFGGGVPTGDFRGARVERAARGLSLQNAGDVLTLRDAEGEIVAQASWGDCAERACVADHWPGELDIGGSLARVTSGPRGWRVHESRAGVHFSPGVPE